MDTKQIKKAIKDNPTLNTTELAQKLAGGYNGGHADEYHRVIRIINTIKRAGTRRPAPPVR